MTAKFDGDAPVVPTRGIHAAKAKEIISHRTLLIVAVVGAAMVTIHAVLELRGDSWPLSGMMLEIGAGAMLFAVFFWIERRVVSHSIASHLGLLSREQADDELATETPQTPGDFYEDVGPFAMASGFVQALYEQEYETVWDFTSFRWRLVQAQAWLYNNREYYGIETDSDSRDLVTRLVKGPEADQALWAAFERHGLRPIRAAISDYDPEKWGWSRRRRIVGPRHEVIYAMPLPDNAPHGFVIDQPTAIPDTIKILVELVETGEERNFYLVAGINTHAPTEPGWPPSMWIVDEPVASAVHPGANKASEDDKR